ncbi:MAG: hypothetical protein H6667_04730 [Ardenticatenaceae bacterium]|nr:hypothetical protein [Ardenticatenaceae bacterium]
MDKYDLNTSSALVTEMLLAVFKLRRCAEEIGNCLFYAHFMERVMLPTVSAVRNLPAMKNRLLSPTLVQRDFGRIIRQIGTPAQPPKPRFISSGRPKGMKLPPRPHRKVVIKSQKEAKPP